MRINYSALVNGLWEMTLLNKMGEVRRFDRVCLNLESDIDSILLRLPARYGGIYPFCDPSMFSLDQGSR